MVLVRRMWTAVMVMGGAMLMRSVRAVVEMMRSMRSVVVWSMRSVVHEARCSSLVHWLRSNSEFGERRVS